MVARCCEISGNFLCYKLNFDSVVVKKDLIFLFKPLNFFSGFVIYNYKDFDYDNTSKRQQHNGLVRI